MAAAGPFGLGPMELVIILLVLVMLFGASRLGDLGGSLGKGIKEFRSAVKDEDEEEKPESTSSGSNGAAASSNGPESVAAVKCPSCGTLNAAGSKHCNQCGTALTAPVS
jgi:sec-independent protein translocase protein TatA